MRKEKISSAEFKRLVALKVNKLSYEDVTEDDFDRVSDLVFKATSFNGDKTDIDLGWISLFPNISRLRIIGFEINQDIIDMLSKQVNLTMLEFALCQIGEVSFKGLNGKLKSVGFTDCGSLNFKYPEVSVVSVSKSEIDFNNIVFDKVKGIDILDSIIRNGHSLKMYPEIQRVELDGTKIYDQKGNEIQDIEVSDMTKYSHKKQVSLVNFER